MTEAELKNARAWLADSLGQEFAPEALRAPLAAVRKAREILDGAAAALPFEAEPSAAQRLREDAAPESADDA